VYCSEAVKGTAHPEWSPLPSTLKPSSPVEVFIAIHVVSLTEFFTREEGKYREGSIEALQKKRAFIPPEAEEEKNRKVVATSESDNQDDTFTTVAAVNGEETDNLESLKCSLVDYLEETIPGKVLAAYFIKFNELFSLGQHLAGSEGGAAFFSASALDSCTAANTNLEPNTLIFDFFDGEYGAYPWPAAAKEKLQSEKQQQDKKAISSAASVVASKEPTPFPSPTKGTNKVSIEGLSDALNTLEKDDGPTTAVEASLIDAPDSAVTTTATASTAATTASLGLGSMLMSKLRGSAPNAAGGDVSASTKSGTATPTNGNVSYQLGGGSSGGGGGVSGSGKVLPADHLREQIQSIVTLQTRIQQLSTRCKDSQARIETILQEQAPARQQHAELQHYQDEKNELVRKHTILSQRVVDVSKRATLTEKSATVTSQALISTLQALQSAQRRISAGQTSLKGEEGRGRLAMALRELIARRCLMTVQLGWILRLGPATMRMPVTPPGGLLDAQLEHQWAGGGGASGGVSGSGGGGGGGSQRKLSPRGGGQRGGTAEMYLQEEVRLAICGLGLDSSVWAHAFDPGGYDWDPNQDKAASVALGYAALLIEKLAEYLGIVLRYPVVYRGSVSVVMDNHPQAGTWKPEIVGSASGGGGGVAGSSFAAASFLFGRTTTSASGSATTGGESGTSTTSASPAVAVTPVEYPLYCLTNRDRPRFAVGVFLLNKNAIQLLQAHGISAAGPSQLLQNLHKLVAAAQSGIPQGLGSGYWR
jgi:hypothetical protein